MREMKESGIKWIGEIPEDWGLGRIGQFYAERNVKVSDKDYPPLSITKNGVVPQLSSAAKTNDTDNRKLVKTDDFVINSRSDRRGSCGISPYDGSCSLINIVLEPQQNMCGRYCNYVFKSDLFADEFYKWGNGIVDDLWSTKWSQMKKIYVPYPPIPQQNAIATYLDSKCSQIDFIVEKTRQEIEKLKEYRQSMITEAVTKGLDPDVEMKDSGVEWIGKIPSSWKIGRVKNILDYADKYPIGDGDHGLIKPTDYKDSGIPYIRVQNLTWEGTLDLSKVVYISSETNQKIRGSQLKPNDILIAKTGATIGKVGIIPNDMPISNTTSHVGKITISKKHNPSFLLYVLSSNLVREQLKEISAMQSTRPELGISNMKNLVITIPSRDVQDEIAITLSRKTAQIDLAVRKQYQLIDKLQEYKKSLIYECVTGKKEVASNARSV